MDQPAPSQGGKLGAHASGCNARFGGKLAGGDRGVLLPQTVKYNLLLPLDGALFWRNGIAKGRPAAWTIVPVGSFFIIDFNSPLSRKPL
jgi:hypothetical protein